ncbi:MAG: transposase, partial [Gemmatimonadota bacterium]
MLAHIESFLERVRAPDAGHGLPRFVERELRRYLECGLLAHGFARLHCSRCLRDELVAFSCKGRGFCPSCGGRRMVDTAAHLVDHVLPHAPVRQWVLSFPYRIRFLLASSPRLCAAVRGIVTRTLLGWLEQRAIEAAAEGSARSRSSDCAPSARPEPQFTARSGAVVFAQRFGSALNLNLHFHALLLDGAFVSPSARLAPSFQPAAPLTDADVAELVEQLARRITRYLERQGRLPRAHSPADADEPAEHDAALFDQLCAASVQGGAALAPESSRPIARLGQRRPPRPPPLPGSLCADRGGFSLHAKVLVPAGELERLEHLCRYVTRPPIATQRLVLAPDGRVIYGLKRHWRDGTSAVSFDPLTFIERLAARNHFATPPRRRCDSSLRDEPRLTSHPRAPISSPTT